MGSITIQPSTMRHFMNANARAANAGRALMPAAFAETPHEPHDEEKELHADH
jgi:hypothetical protein